MRRVLRWIYGLLIILLVAIGALLVYVYVASNRLMAATYVVNTPELTIPSDAGTIARGKYLVERVSSCTGCHGDDLGGKVIIDNIPMGRLAGANLTRGRGGLPSDFGDRDYVRALLHGVKRDGRSLIFMPSQDYHFTEADAAAIIAYVKSVPPVDRDIPPPSIGPAARALGLFTAFPLTPASKIDHQRIAFLPPKDPTDPVASGESLVAAAGCRGCHNVDLSGGVGPPPGGANITPVGIGAWSEADFVRAIRDHKRPDGSDVNEAMPRTFGLMSDGDLHRLYAYLKTVPPAGKPTHPR